MSAPRDNQGGLVTPRQQDSITEVENLSLRIMRYLSQNAPPPSSGEATDIATTGRASETGPPISGIPGILGLLQGTPGTGGNGRGGGSERPPRGRDGDEGAGDDIAEAGTNESETAGLGAPRPNQRQDSVASLLGTQDEEMNDFLRQSQQHLSGVADASQDIWPFICLFGVFFLGYYLYNIVTLVVCSLILAGMNDFVRLQASQRNEHFARQLVNATCWMFIFIFVLMFVERGSKPWLRLAVLPMVKALPFFSSLWLMIVTDLIVRGIIISLKAMALVVLPEKISKRRQGHLLAAVEAIARFYRICLPAPVWIIWFESTSSYSYVWVSSLAFFFYTFLKWMQVLRHANLIGKAVNCLLRNQLPFGRFARREEVMEDGSTCTICHDDMKNPIILGCDHIFCDDCITEWLNRDKTCPLCRTEVRMDGHQVHMNGATGMLPILW